GYPGGPIIDRVAQGANDAAVDFTVAKMSDGRPDFSFSGVKTAVLYHVRKEGIAPVADPARVPAEIRDLVASFQRAVVAALLRGLRRAAAGRPPQGLLLPGRGPAPTPPRAGARGAAGRLRPPSFVAAGALAFPQQ